MLILFQKFVQLSQIIQKLCKNMHQLFVSKPENQHIIELRCFADAILKYIEKGKEKNHLFEKV